MVATNGSTFTGRWNGESQIVIGIDIGTTCSGVAYTFLQKGVNQQLYRVDTWPGQGFNNSSGKIPTLIYYDSNGQAVAFGAEAATHKAGREAKMNNWQLAKEFKLHLHPASLRQRHKLRTCDLPNGVGLKKIYSDFLRYLIKHTKSRFEAMVADGKKIWENYRSNMTIVIAHPNGWGLPEQTFLREAAIDAGLSTSEDAKARIRFVTEAEASVHFCMHYTNVRSSLEIGTNFVLCDAGGSTVDTTLYTVNAKEPNLRLGELRESACVQAGAIYVNDEAEKFLSQFFEKPEAGLTQTEINAHVSAGVQDFEKDAKRQFGSGTDDEKIIIKFAGDDFMNEELGVLFGGVELESTDVSSFFDPCVERILESVQSLVSSTEIKYIALVGGFGDSAYLQGRLKGRFKTTDCQLLTPGETASKAVADGAVVWHAANTVFKRVPRFAYGTDYMIPFNASDPEHRDRKQIESITGTRIDGAWAEIVSKDTPIDSDEVHRHTFSRVLPIPMSIPLFLLCASPLLQSGLSISDDIYAYSSESAGSCDWLTNKFGDLNEGFHKACTIEAEIGDMMNAMAFGKDRRSGNMVCVLKYDICIRFGRTELEAFVEWEEDGVKKTGPAAVVPTSTAGSG